MGMHGLVMAQSPDAHGWGGIAQMRTASLPAQAACCSVSPRFAALTGAAFLNQLDSQLPQRDYRFGSHGFPTWNMRWI